MSIGDAGKGRTTTLYFDNAALFFCRVVQNAIETGHILVSVPSWQDGWRVV